MIHILGFAVAAWTATEIATVVTAVAGSVTAIATAGKAYCEYKTAREEDKGRGK